MQFTLSTLGATLLFLSQAFSEPPTVGKGWEFAPVSLRQKANFYYNTPNQLQKLADKEHTFEGVPFTVKTDGLRLRGDRYKGDPKKIEGIPVERTFHRLHILHATKHGGRGRVTDGTLVGQYHIQYEDGLIEVIPIVYGYDVRDWWDFGRDKPCKRSKIAWQGDTPDSNRYNATVRLYLSSWKNPRPETLVSSITMVSTGASLASPFCVAITTEGLTESERFLRGL